MKNNNLRTIAEKIVEAVNNESSDLDGIEAVEVILKGDLPIQIHEGIENTHVEVTSDGVIIKPNSKLLNNTGVGNIGLQHMKQIREQTMKKWTEAGFLDGITGDVKENIAKMYECCASARLNDADITGDTTNNILPIAMKVYAKTWKNPDNK